MLCDPYDLNEVEASVHVLPVDVRQEYMDLEKLICRDNQPVISELEEIAVNNERTLLCGVLLSMLPPIQRELMDMVFFHDCTVTEVGNELHISVDQVAELMSEAFATMRAGRKVMAVPLFKPVQPPKFQVH